MAGVMPDKKGHVVLYREPSGGGWDQLFPVCQALEGC